MSEENETRLGMTEIQMLRERAKTMGISYSGNTGAATLRAKIEAKMAGEDAEAIQDQPDDDQNQGGEDIQEQGEDEQVDEREDASPVSTEPVAPVEPVQTVQPVADQQTAPAPVAPTTTDLLNSPEVQALLAQQRTELLKELQVQQPVNALEVGTGVKAPKPGKKKTIYQRQQEEQMRLIRIRIQNLDPKKKDLPGEFITVANEYLGTVRKFIPYGEVTDNGWHVPYVLYKQLEKRKFQNIRVRKVQGKEKVEYNWAKEFAIEVLPPLTEKEIANLAAAQAAAGGLND